MKTGDSWGIALSGGGFRATAFHVGVVAFLRDAKILSHVTHICSVSGGSILAAHMLLHWKQYITTDDAVFHQHLQSVIDIMRRDVRGRVVRRYLTQWLLAQLCRACTFGRVRLNASTAVLLESEYRKQFLGNALNGDIHGAPSFDLLASNLTIGGSCSFTRGGFSLHHRFAGTSKPQTFRSASIPISFAVTASSAFPSFVAPLLINKDLIPDDTLEPSDQLLTDGGVFDNLGSRRFRTLLDEGIVNRVIVSDAGRPFQKQLASQLGDPFLGPVVRAVDMMGERVNLFEKEAISGDERFTLISITDSVETRQGENSDGYYDPQALPYDVQVALRFVRTDLDRFELGVISMLIIHGYCVARKAFTDALPDGIETALPPRFQRIEHGKDSSAGIARIDGKPDLKIVKAAAKRRLRLFSFRDIASGIHILILLTTVGMLVWTGRTVAPYVDEAWQALRSYYVVHGTGVPNVWSDSTRPTDVATIKPPDYSGFEVQRDIRIWDLRRWKWVDDLESAGKVSPVFMTRKITLKRRLGYENVHLQVDIRSRARSVEARCLGHQTVLRHQQTPTSYLDSGSDKGNRMSGMPVQLWQLEIDVSNDKEDSWFDLEVNALFWNNFQDEGGDSVSMQIDADQSEVGVWLILPESRAFKPNSFERYMGPQLSNVKISTGGDVYASKDNRSVFWRILNPTPLYYYKLKWQW